MGSEGVDLEPYFQAMAQKPEQESSQQYKDAMNEAEQFPVDAIPVPTGPRILIMMHKGKDTFDNTGIVKADLTQAREQFATQVGQVVDMGPDAYKDSAKFPSGPWCEIGSWVMVHRYVGRSFKIGGQLFRLVYDDQVEGIVRGDPKFIVHL